MSTHYIETLPGIHWNGDETDCLCGNCMAIRVNYCGQQNKYNGIQGFSCVRSYQMYPGQAKRWAREQAERDAKYIASLVERVNKAESLARNDVANLDMQIDGSDLIPEDPKTKEDRIKCLGDEARQSMIAKIWAELAAKDEAKHLDAFNKALPQIGKGTNIDQPIFSFAISEAVRCCGYWQRSVLEWFLTKWTHLHPSAGIQAVRSFGNPDSSTSKNGKIDLFVYCVKKCYNKKLLFQECIRFDNDELLGSIRMVTEEEKPDLAFYEDLAQLARAVNATKCLEFLEKTYNIIPLDDKQIEQKRIYEAALSAKNEQKKRIIEEARKKMDALVKAQQEETARQLRELELAC